MTTPAVPGLIRACVWCLAMLSLHVSNAMSAQQAPRRGVIVESVEPGSAAERGGLRVGDVLTSWTRAASPPANPLVAQGELTSPFDLAEIEIEQAPRGTITLRGSRAGARLAIEMPVGGWQVTARPALSDKALDTHSRALAAAAAAQVDEAVALWRSAAAGADDDAVAAWLLLQAATALRNAKRPADARRLIDAILGTPNRPLDIGTVVALHDARAETYLRENDVPGVESAYRVILELRQREGRETLSLARAISDVAFVGAMRGELDRAEASLRETLRIQQKLAPDSLAVVKTFNNLGTVADRVDDLKAASMWLSDATAILEQILPNTIELAAALNNLGSVAWRRGELERAQALHERALAIRQRLEPDSLAVASSLSNLGIVASDRGRLADSERHLRQALAIMERQAPGSDEEAAVHLNLGNRLRMRGDLIAAETHYLRSLAIREKARPNSLVFAQTLHSLGILAGERGDQIRSKDYVERALALGEKLAPDSLNVAETLNTLGVIASERGDLPAAETYHRRALAIREREAPNSPSVAHSLSNLGEIAETRRDLPAARKLYEAARELLEKVAPGGPELARVLGNLGDVADLRGESGEAVRLFSRALEQTEQTAPESASHAHALRRLGLQALKRKDAAAAAAFFERSIDALESQTVRLGGSDEVRAAFAGQTHEYYKEYIDTLLALDQHAAAFAVLERSRARALLMVLAERDLGFDRDLPPEVQRARQDLGAEYDRVQQSLAELKPGTDAVEGDRLRVKLRDLREARTRIVESIRAASPRLASLQYPQPLDLAGAHQALDSGTVLLSYAVGKQRTLLFVVGRDSSPAASGRVTVHVLPIGEQALREQVAAFRGAIERHPDATHLPVIDHARRLFDALIAPAQAAVAAADRVLVSPDGPLHNLPFAALARGREQTSGAGGRPHQYLIEWKPVHTAVSATVYAELKRTRPASPPPATLVAFGDPRYTRRTSAGEETATLELRDILRRGYNLEPLPATRAEVTSIAQPFGDRATTYLGAEATEERAKSVRSARYLHFATHGLLDARMPLNSSLALTLPEQLAANADNGLLQAWEIFEQMRIDADLVTLSACETALGAELSGEGLVGLTRAFHYAGARSVLASLWSVADESTGGLMAGVYRHLHEGRPKDEALRRAQLEAIDTPATSAPFHWAAFTLTGDWR